MADIKPGENKNKEQEDTADLLNNADQQEPAAQDDTQPEQILAKEPSVPAQAALMAGLTSDQIGLNAKSTSELQNPQYVENLRTGPDAQDVKNYQRTEETVFTSNPKSNAAAFEQINKGLQGAAEGHIAGVMGSETQTLKIQNEERRKERIARYAARMSVDQTTQQIFEDINRRAQESFMRAQQAMSAMQDTSEDVQKAAQEAQTEYNEELEKLESLNKELEDAKANGATEEEIAAIQDKIDAQKNLVDLKQAVAETQNKALDKINEKKGKLEKETAELKGQMDDLQAQLSDASPEEAEKIRAQMAETQAKIDDLNTQIDQAEADAKSTKDISAKIETLAADGEISKADLQELKTLSNGNVSNLGLVKDLTENAYKTGINIEGIEAAAGEQKLNELLAKELAMYDLEQREMENALRLQSDPENEELKAQQNSLMKERLELDQLGFECRLPGAYHMEEAWESEEWKNAETQEEKNEIEKSIVKENYARALPDDLAEKYKNGEYTDQQILSAVNDYYYGPPNKGEESPKQKIDYPSTLLYAEDGIDIDFPILKDENDQIYVLDPNTGKEYPFSEMIEEDQKRVSDFIAKNGSETIAQRALQEGHDEKTAETETSEEWSAQEALTLEADEEYMSLSGDIASRIEGGNISREELDQIISSASPEMKQKLEASLDRQGISVTEPEEANKNTNDKQAKATYDLIGANAPIQVINEPTVTPSDNGIEPATAYVPFADSPEFAATNDPSNPDATYAAKTNNHTENVKSASANFGKPATQPQQPALGTSGDTTTTLPKQDNSQPDNQPTPGDSSPSVAQNTAAPSQNAGTGAAGMM